MKQFFTLLFTVLILFSCGKKEAFKPRDITKVQIETLVKDSLLNVRALEINKSDDLYFSGNYSSVGFVNFNHFDNQEQVSIINYDGEINSELEFRSISQTTNNLFFISISSPSYLYKIKKKDCFNVNSEIIIPTLVYQENHLKAFYDSMDFWNDEEGIAIGDSTDGCLSVIITRDGGNTWNKLSCDDLPKGTENEGAFAASDTNIAIVGDNTWVATTAGRVYYSPDKGNTWEVFDTPIVKDKETEGIYSIDFYDESNGFAIGGDYTKPDDNATNKIRTQDGGKTWQLVAQNQNPGYRSCVQYIPNRKGKELVAIGFKGIDYSNDSGTSWKHLSDEGFYTIRFLNDSIAYAAGAGRISKLTFRE